MRQRLFIDLQTSEARSAETKALTKSFGWTSGQQYQQQDVSEMFNVLFDALETSFKGTRGDGIIKVNSTAAPQGKAGFLALKQCLSSTTVVFVFRSKYYSDCRSLPALKRTCIDGV